MDRQPCATVNVPSYRFTDVEMATEGSLSVEQASTGQVRFVRSGRYRGKRGLGEDEPFR